MIKILTGGSPCTSWSIAQSKNRETTAEGIGWELFRNFLVAREKYQPDYFLYENNKSMAKAIRNQIDVEFCRPYAESPYWVLVWEQCSKDGHCASWRYRHIEGYEKTISRILINSALVSAQNRQRYYWTDIPDVEQPEDRGIFLRDILESGYGYGTMKEEKSYALTATYCNGAAPERTIAKSTRTQVAEPVCLRYERTDEAKKVRKQYEDGEIQHGFNEFRELHPRTDGKSNTLSTVLKDNRICEPVRIGTIENGSKTSHDSRPFRVYSPDAKGISLMGNAGNGGAKTGLYAVPLEYNPLRSCGVVVTDENIKCVYKDGSGTAQGYTVYFDDVKAPSVIAGHAQKMKIIERATGKEHPVYEVQDGLITIKGKTYPIKLADGYYIIRKLTVLECMRLQTIPEWYDFPVSDTQAYKMLGNGWSCDVIAHILSHAPEITTEPVEVLSMYDGMSCGHIALDKLGADVVRYYATEIDKYAIQTTQHNYPDTIQLGDAFQVREDGWKPERTEQDVN